jgi:diguanylate cyclase (GGDEF)-like protein
MAARLRHERELARAATSDALTGLLSRRQLLRALAAAEPGDTVVLLDVDGFKEVNDRYGHDRGDAVLEALGRTLVTAVRDHDVVGRYGGDEIVLLLRAASPEAAERRVQELRDLWTRVRPAAVSLSAGVAAVTADGWRSALREADAAMYADKRRRAGVEAT